MNFTYRILSLIILLNITVSGSLGETLRVTCSPQTICALRESTVTLQCSHSNTNIRPQHSFWFSNKQKAKWRNEEDPEDLALDSDYAGRVRYTTNRNRYSSTLTISELRERDSGEYHLMIITETGQKYSSSTAVTLTVSDLKMRMTSDTKNQMELTCSSSCSLTSKPYYYYWYKNGQYQYSTNEHQMVLSSYSSDDSGGYSCSVLHHIQIYSNTVCINDKNCWSVTYSDRRVCALEGSSVDFPCTYSYPRDQTVTKTFWYYFRPQVEPTDLSVEEQFAGRVEFLGDKERNCTLRMNNLTKSDSGEYHFRFITDTAGGRFSGEPGVILSVADLQVKVSPTTPSEGQTVTLTCISTCTLPNNTTYIWYKNGQPITNRPTRYNKLYLESANTEDVLQYSCAVGGPDESTVGCYPVFLCFRRFRGEHSVNVHHSGSVSLSGSNLHHSIDVEVQFDQEEEKSSERCRCSGTERCYCFLMNMFL
ncbi:sialoadhesin-like [Colossoma macropomum]|uniref:sialoadhesin-like n=1 Tax=Colossoma macropomum TaxID=42526 RepID=UPI0018644D73|nr:sialoadhesin-like [Colossoma macropomum]